MGCGCGRSKINRYKRIKSNLNKKINFTNINNEKLKICLSCINSKPTKSENKTGISVCHKKNRLIKNIIKDKNFKCPIGKWKNI